MKIPEIRERLHELAAEAGMYELHILADELKRRPYVRRAPARAMKMNDEIAAAIRALATKHPDWPYTTIAKQFGVNPGRVSEVLAGFRE